MVSLGIPEFYAGKSIFITGASGFMGKVLVEKLLRSCPDVDMIYILIRSKRGKTAQQRWETLTEMPVFDLLKKERPTALSTKITVLDGDVSNEYLGLKNEDYKLLQDNVNIIFHVAASVRFNEPMNDAVRLNSYGTLQVINLAHKVKNLKVLVYVSTAYSNCQRTEVEEKIYPSIRDWKEVMNVVENTDPEVLSILTDKYLNDLPNTYVFSKSLAENIVWENKDKLPVVIFRPTIVISSWKEPVPGWIDNFNGPVGMLIGVAKGVIRTVPQNPNAMADFTLVDLAIKALIVSAWKRGTSTKIDDIDYIYNCASTYKNVTNWKLTEICMDLHEKNPTDQIMWYPNFSMCENLFWFRLQAFYKHFIPALIIDTLLRIIGKKPMLLKLQTKIHESLTALSYFLFRYWKFHNDNFLNLIKEIPQKDLKAFDYDFSKLDPKDYFENSGMVGGKKYLLKEENVNPENCRKKFLILKFLYYGFLITFRLGLLWTLYKFICRFTD